MQCIDELLQASLVQKGKGVQTERLGQQANVTALLRELHLDIEIIRPHYLLICFVKHDEVILVYIVFSGKEEGELKESREDQKCANSLS